MNDDSEVVGITSDVNLSDDKSDEELDDENPKKEATKPDWEADDNPYKIRYGESTREFQRLSKELQDSHGTSLKDKADRERLESELATLGAKLKEEKPEAYDNLAMKKALDGTARQLAELKEAQELDGFTSSEPLAKSYREALKSHARANPNLSLQDIWNRDFKEVAETKAQIEKDKATRKTKSRTDDGKGSSTADPTDKRIGGYTEAEFNKLPVAKRREVLIKLGEL